MQQLPGITSCAGSLRAFHSAEAIFSSLGAGGDCFVRLLVANMRGAEGPVNSSWIHTGGFILGQLPALD